MIVREIVADMYGCNEEFLNDPEVLFDLCRKGALEVKATVVNKLVHRYNPQGVSVILILAESHIYIATWPEFKFATVNIFLCNDKMDPQAVLNFIKEGLEAKEMVNTSVPHRIGPKP